MRKSILVIAAALVTALATHPVSAQGDNGEFYGGIGVGYGAYDLSASGFSLPSDYKNNYSAYGEFGLRLSHLFALGLEADYYTKEANGTTFKVWYYNVAAAFYPFGKSQFWLKALAGYANTTGDVTFSGGGGYGSGSPSQGGYDMGIGLGYDIRFGHEGKFAIVPFAQYIAQLAGGTVANDPSGAKYSSNLLMIGAGLAFVH